ncbi:MAG TPA: PDZ domain-containing protein [Blastocatellia bacterium]|nr:PDZ domain-containing protein [Blastocatellia bacterium]HMX25109.1 PDZ domain-containing protein [Blastocatellia bacterium]HMY71477.1 PDZ domain-containing protein [Blastocatellia bacterium]HMZ17571.1 PDZ domain-containing protein [Blastocatellia bacterium]HNG31572.1 PDZ domain-containing protein [Blastocatellia bacterium]
MRKLLIALLILLTVISIDDGFSSAQSQQTLLMRQPTMNATHIAFAYAGDLWTVNREGGEASRLTTGAGREFFPRFSPDGKTVAFTGEYDGNIDLYTVPATGGVPKRVTYHPGDDVLSGWTPDGKQLLFTSQRDAGSYRYGRLFTIPADGVNPNEVPLPMAYDGAYSPDGTRLAYEPLPRGFNAWKRYRGGMATPLWIANLNDSAIEKIPRTDSNDFNAMWISDKVYFLSDRSGPITLFSYDTKTKKVAQLIQNSGLDIKSASAAGDAIIYEQFGSINIYDLKTGKSRKVNVTINADQLALRPKFEKVGNRVGAAAISPTGARAVFEARGEIISVPAEKGDARNLTNTSGVAERSPSWSPDGKWIAYFSDESGEYELHLRDQKAAGEVKKIKLEKSFYYSPNWSPDSKKIAFSDKRLNIWYVDVEKGTPVKVDTLSRGFSLASNWSPDSRWLTYAKPLKSWYNAVYVYSLEDAKSHQLTDGLSDAASPVFDRSGKYLYFTASTDIGPRVFGFDMSSYPHRPTRSVYVAVLKKTDPSPLAPESDEEKVAEEKKDGEKGGQGEGAKPAEQNAQKPADAAQAVAAKPGDKKEPPKVTIDLDNFSQRILALPAPNRNYVGLEVGKAGTLYIAEFPDGAQGAVLHKFDLEKRKLDKALDNVGSLEISANGEKMLYRQGPGWFIASTAMLGTPAFKPGDGRIKTEDMEVHVDPRAEWNQMYRETWRIERDFFYDPNYHGLDLQATAKKYEPYLNSLAHRADLNYLFQEMLGELTIGHLYVSGGDTPDPKRVAGGLLGADYKIENGRYRFAKVYNGESWNPQLRAPLTQPGVNVAAGEYLLAVKGRNLTANDNIYSFFESTAGKQVVIKVGPNPDGTGAREVTVVPVGSEGGLRNLAWVEDNRRKVDQLSGGKLAYVYLPDTAGGGYTFFNRYYFSQLDKQGVVIDERFNSGGQAADYVIDYLRKPLMSYWAVRDGEDWRQPFGVMPGPKAMLTNEYSGSGGDYLPYMFKRAGLGPLIGKRTWGGLVGIGGYPDLIDGGSITAPHFAFYTPEGKWEIENHGVAPDIELDWEPKAWREGHDVQLERAVNYLLEELKKNPPKDPKRPAYPNYHNNSPMMPAGQSSQSAKRGGTK